MAKKKLMTFVEFEAFIAQNEWIPDDFDHECNPDHAWFRVDTTAITKELNGISSKILASLNLVPKEGVELRHLERNALELRLVVLGRAKKVFFFGSAGVGKLSIFNGLFNMPGLAKTGAKGDACTSIVVQYSAAAKDCTEGFNVLKQVLRPAIIKDFIEAHSKVYY